ncbi:MAG: PadR family transcriptional regulator [Longimicrobiales bacterium]
MGRRPGEVEQMILAAVLRRGNRAYGVEILEEIEKETGRSIASGALSVSLDRLEQKGLVTTEGSEPSPERGGRPRRYARLTAEGLLAIQEMRSAMLALWDGLEESLDP